MEEILHHPVRVIATLFVSGLWGFVLVAFVFGLGKLVFQKSWALSRRLTRPLRIRRCAVSAQAADLHAPDDATLARWLQEAAPADADTDPFALADVVS